MPACQGAACASPTFAWSSLKGHKRDTKRSQTFLNLVSSVVRNRGIGKSRGGRDTAQNSSRDAPASFFLTIEKAASRKTEISK